MVTDAYPANRTALFALHFAKWLYQSGAANEVGPDATALILAVAMVEDELRYTRPPNFYNRQLMDRCGVASEHALIRARKLAVDAGLLSYTPGKKRTPGKYYVLGFTAESAAKSTGNPQLPCAKHSEPPIYTAQNAAQAKPSTPSPKNEDSRGKKPRRSLKFAEGDLATAKWMFQSLLEQHADHGKPNLESWANTIRLMRDEDGRSDSDIRAIWANVRRDNFWQKNILAPEKLRKQWDSLVIKGLGPKRKDSHQFKPVVKARKETTHVA